VQRACPGYTTRRNDAHRSRLEHALAGRLGVLSLVCATLLGCSTTFGAAGTYSVHPDEVGTIGAKTSSMLDLGLFAQEAHVALGVETQLLHRLTGPGDAGGQWRLLGLAGLTHMAKPYENMFGYELLFKGGVARDDTDGSPDIVGVLGASFGVPLRLACPAPTWRSDSLAAFGTYIVPEVGIHSLGLDDTLEFTGGLSFRVHLWSAFMP
jgi:hypothetical protein